MTESFSTHTFSNGLRLIHMPSPTDVAYCGMAIDAGTRDEEPEEQGMAHFCEHMLFKGTQRRRAWHILNRMEAVGGNLNAYTTKEETFVYAAFMRQHLERAIDLLLDVTFGSTFPQHEIDKEAEVIVEEIDSYKDTPSELIFDDFENLLFQHHPLGHDILGTPERVRLFRTDDALRFTRRLYRPERMVLFVFGRYEFEKVVKTVEKLLRPLSFFHTNEAKEVKPFERAIAPLPLNATDAAPAFHIRRTLHTHQAHVMMGCRGFDSHDDRRIALYFLNNLIGGPGMNSLLNVSLREHKGLVYTVESALTNYTDTATFSIYFGCDSHDVERCIELVHKELAHLAEQPLSAHRFQAAMKQTRGQIGVACDNFENYALDMAKSYLHYNRFENIDDTYRHLDHLTPQRLQEVAQYLFIDQNLSTLVYL